MAVVDAEVAWEVRRAAEQAVTDAEVAAVGSIERLLDERLAVKDVVQLTGLDLATVRRLRQLQTYPDDGDEEVGTTVGGADHDADAWVVA